MKLSNMTAELNYSRADLVAINDELALIVLPVIVILSVMVVLGVLGNSLVCYIFCFRLRPSTQNYLIVYLAVFDLFSSTIGLPTGILDLRNLLTFDWEVVCKFMAFFHMFCTIGSVFTLVVIAVDRFRKVCRPLKRQLSIKHIKYSLIPITGIAIFHTWPVLVLYTLRPKKSGIPGLLGKECLPPKSGEGVLFFEIYTIFLFTSFGVVATSLMVIYCRVLRETKRHTRYTKTNSEFHLTQSQHVHHEDSSDPDHCVNTPSGTTTDTSLTTDEILHTTSGTPLTFTGRMPEPARTSNMAALGDNNLETQSPEETSESSLKEKVPTQETKFMGRKMPEGSTMSKEKKEKKKSSFQLDPDTEIGIEKDTTRKQPSWTDDQMKEEDLTEVAVIRSNSNHELTSHLTFVSSGNGGNDVTTASKNPDTSKNKPRAFCITPKPTLPCEETKDNKKSRAQRFESKTTKIAFLVTLVFILSFLPHLCVNVIPISLTELEIKRNRTGLVLYHFFYRSYFLNSISNPFIYGALNAKFKVEVKRLIRQMGAFCKRK